MKLTYLLIEHGCHSTTHGAPIIPNNLHVDNDKKKTNNYPT